MTSVYFSQGRKSENLFHEDLIVESIKIYGQEFFYIPRVLVAKDNILGEDRLSEFKTAYGIDMYLENADGFDGQGAFIQKFGLMMEQSATLSVARRTWEQLIGRFGKTVIPDRPCEGDLLYFPLTGGLFEIKFVTHQDPFYQQGKLFLYKLQVELFQYASERINTSYNAIDDFETLKSFDIDINEDGKVVEVYVRYGGSYPSTPTIQLGANWAANAVVTVGQEVCQSTRRYVVTTAGTTGSSAPTHTSGIVASGTAQLKYVGTRATASITMEGNAIHRASVVDQGSGYTSAPTVYTIGPADAVAELIAVVSTVDNPNSYGDNSRFKEEANEILFNEDNPFGELK